IGGRTLPNRTPAAQAVVAGTEEVIEAVLAQAKAKGVRGQRLPVACGFHSPLVAPARPAFERALAEGRFQAPRLPVFSNTTAGPHPDDHAALAAPLAQHLTSPVPLPA